MSSRYVRNLMETWLKDPAMAVPYYLTVNEEQDPQDDVWCTCDFSSNYRETMTFCEGVTSEEGEVEVVYYGLPGKGYDALIQMLEADMLVLMARRDPKLALLNRSAPFEFSGGSADEMYAMSVYVDYQLFE